MFATIKNKIDEKMPELSAKMKELGDKIVPPGQAGPPKEERPDLLPLRALQQVPPMHSDGLPEKRLLVVLQPPEELPEAPAPAGTYSPVVVVGNMVYVSGIDPSRPRLRLTSRRSAPPKTKRRASSAPRTERRLRGRAR